MSSKYIPPGNQVPKQVRKREKENEYKKISMQDIKDAVVKAFEPREGLPKNRQPGYYTPVEVSPGLWKIGDLWTGDGGKELFDEAVKKVLMG